MKLLVVANASPKNQYSDRLEFTLKANGVDYWIADPPWTGWGTKFKSVYEACKDPARDFTHVMHLDAYDTILLAREHEILQKFSHYDAPMVVSTEKACWPDAQRADSYFRDSKYPWEKYLWHFANSGGYMAEREYFIHIMDKYEIAPAFYKRDDQRDITNIVVNEDAVLDYECLLFQSVAFSEREKEFALSPRDYSFKNMITGSMPCVIHGNGRTPIDDDFGNFLLSMNLKSWSNVWRDTKDFHDLVNNTFRRGTTENHTLNTHRTFVEQHAYGFGERAFPWFWDLLITQLVSERTFSNENFASPLKFLEVGVFRGQITSLVSLICKKMHMDYSVTGVTLCSTEGGKEFPKYAPSEFYNDIMLIHDRFEVARPDLIIGDSTDPTIIQTAAGRGMYDIAYVDGGHDYLVAKNDLEHYPDMVAPGGYLVVDDCGGDYHMPWGFFQGIPQVTRAVNETIRSQPEKWEHIFSVVHIDCWRRK